MSELPEDLDELRRYAERVAQEQGVATVIVAAGTDEPREFVVSPDRLSAYADPVTGALVEAVSQAAGLGYGRGARSRSVVN